jgi:hypothetical protein
MVPVGDPVAECLTAADRMTEHSLQHGQEARAALVGGGTVGPPMKRGLWCSRESRLKAYADYKRSGRGNHVLLYDGSRARHYALTD